MKTIALWIAAAAVLMAADGATLYEKCASCHGDTAEKAALGKSQIIKGWESAKIADALKGYQAGTYGGAMKALMKGQVASYSPDDIKAVADYIATLK